jgi:hypothetical protein
MSPKAPGMSWTLPRFMDADPHEFCLQTELLIPNSTTHSGRTTCCGGNHSQAQLANYTPPGQAVGLINGGKSLHLSGRGGVAQPTTFFIKC